jgi:N-acylneuraminate cytidylyltransferase
LSGRVGLFEMPEETYFEVDEPSDWLVIEHILRKTRQSAAGLKDRWKNIRLVATDMDGVLTDAGMYYSAEGDELKRFSARDGKGFELLRQAGVQTAIVTAESTPIAERRARKLQVENIFTGAKDKAPLVGELLQRLGLEWSQLLYIGDDINDIEVMSKAGIAACPADALPSVRAVANHHCEARGGHGAFREVADLVVAARTLHPEH